MAVNYYNKYVSLFEFGQRTQRGFVKMNPKNFYRISRYEYSDGETKSLSGKEASLVFVIGAFDDKISCIKLNEVLPDLFMNWIPTLIKSNVKVDDVDIMEQFSDLVSPSDRGGTALFESKIKTSRIYRQGVNSYRTYNLDGLKYIQKINLKKEIIKKLL